jgi:hypothetical protein
LKYKIAINLFTKEIKVVFSQQESYFTDNQKHYHKESKSLVLAPPLLWPAEKRFGFLGLQDAQKHFGNFGTITGLIMLQGRNSKTKIKIYENQIYHTNSSDLLSADNSKRSECKDD